MGRIVEEDSSSLKAKVLSFISHRNKNGKRFIESTRWENPDYGCQFVDDSAYVYCLVSPKEPLSMPREEVKGRFTAREGRASKDLNLKFYRHGKDEKNLYVECYLTNPQDEDSPHIIKEIYSFVSIMVTDNADEIVQLQRYDISGRIHENRIINDLTQNDSISEEERSLINQYFGQKVDFPHFHFTSVTYQDKLSISLNNLIHYILDLMDADEKSDINKYSLGLPFLKIKQMSKHSSIDMRNFVNDVHEKLNNIASKYSGNVEKSIIHKINRIINSLNLTNLTGSSIEQCLVKLVILKILSDTTGYAKAFDNLFNSSNGGPSGGGGSSSGSSSGGDDKDHSSEGSSGNSDNSDKFSIKSFVDELYYLQMEIANELLSGLEFEKTLDYDTNSKKNKNTNDNGQHKDDTKSLKNNKDKKYNDNKEKTKDKENINDNDNGREL